LPKRSEIRPTCLAEGEITLLISEEIIPSSAEGGNKFFMEFSDMVIRNIGGLE
jgi:hypothetical protein